MTAVVLKDPRRMTRDELIETVQRERGLLADARAALDRLAATSPAMRGAALVDAADVAQRIVDEIGTRTENAFGPYYRDVIDGLIRHATDTTVDPARRLHQIVSICKQTLIVVDYRPDQAAATPDLP